MKRFFITLGLALTLSGTAPAQTIFTLAPNFQTPKREVRAMWLTTLKGLDWPKRTANTAEETRLQQEALCRTLDQLQAAGINTVLFQSRIRSTTSYPSAIEPWDDIYTGVPGKAPLYDPLAFALEECHKRGMELHAWVVAFPICDVKVERKLGKMSLPAKHPKLVQRCGDKWMMDPGVPGTDDYIASICEEIVKKYDVDGIHLDYIRYPEKGIPFNDRNTFRKYGRGQSLDEWRRDNVTRVAQKIHDKVKAVRPWVKISCSPVGKYADLRQQSSYGWNARDAVYQESQEWLRKGIMDMLFPMMYFDGKHFYPFAIDWQEHAYGRQVVPGLGIYFLDEGQKDWDLDVIRRQMFFLRSIGTAGQAHFRSKFFTDNVKGLYNFCIGDFYHQPVQTPAMTWMDASAPTVPKAIISRQHHTFFLQWEPALDNAPATPVTYNIYYCPTDSFDFLTAQRIATRIKETIYDWMPATLERQRGYYAVTAVDAYGNESYAHPVSLCPTPKQKEDEESLLKKQKRITSPDGWLEVPEVDGAEFFLITDLSGRHVLTLKCAPRIYVAQLRPGSYEIRTLGKKGRSHRLFRFWKE